MKPDLAPTFGNRLSQMSDFEAGSAVPSPLHYGISNPFSGAEDDDEDASTVTGLGISMGGDGSNDKKELRLASVSTLDAGEGRSVGSEQSLRERFLSSRSTSGSTSSRARDTSLGDKINQLLSQLQIITEHSARKDEEMQEVRLALSAITESMTRVEDCCNMATTTLGSLEEALSAQDAAFATSVDESNFTTTKLCNAVKQNETTIAVVTEELCFIEDKTSVMSTKVDAIDFQVCKIDSLATDFATLSSTCQRLDSKVDKLIEAMENSNLTASDTRIEKLEQGLASQTALLDRLNALEQKVRLGDRVVSFGNRLASLEQKVGGVVEEEGIQGTGLWKRRGALAVGTGVGPNSPPVSLNSASVGSASATSTGSLGKGLWTGGLSPEVRASRFPRR